MAERQQRDDGFDCARGTQRMTHHALGRTHRHAIKQLADRLPFGCIIKYRGRSVCVDVIDFVCRNLRALESSFHGLSRPNTGRIRLRDVKIIRGNPVADNFGQDLRAPLSSKLKIFQRENGCTFSQSPCRHDVDQTGGIFLALRLAVNRSP